MKNLNEVRIYGLKPSRSLLRQIERRMEKWGESDDARKFIGRTWSYSLEVERIDTSMFHCWLQIKTETAAWRSQDSGKTIHAAISNALRRLKPAPRNVFDFQSFRPPLASAG